MKIQIGNNITFNIKNNQIDDVKSVSCVLRYSAIPNNSSLYTLNNCNSEYYNALPQNLSMRECPALKDGDVITLNSEYDEDTKTISCIFPKEDLHQVGSYQLVVVLYCDDLNYKYIYEDTLQLYAKYTEFNEDVVINIVGTFSKIETVISSLQDLVDILFNEETGVIYELRREKLAISDYNIMQVTESLIYNDIASSGNIIYFDPGYPATWIPNNCSFYETKSSLFSCEGEWRIVTENYPDDLIFDAKFGDLWQFFDDNSKPLGADIPLSLGVGNNSIKQKTTGDTNIAIGSNSAAFGVNVTALGSCSHVEGQDTIAEGYASHAEGTFTTAPGECSHAEGNITTASGDVSHAEGENTVANGYASHAEGQDTEALHDCEHAEGIYNKSNNNTIHSVGIGSSSDDRKNAHEIMRNGDTYIIGVGNYNGTNPNDSDTLQEVIVSVKHGISLANNEIELINLNLETVVTPTLASLLPKVVEITKSGSTYTTTANYNDVLEHVLNGGHAMFKYDGSKNWDESYCIPISYVEMSVAGIGVNGLCGQVYVSLTASRTAHVSILWSRGVLSITKA